jgi:hypothetical protein
MNPALIAAVVPAAITAAGTVLAALIRARRPVPDESRLGPADGPSPVSKRGHLDEHQAEIGADGMPGRELRPGDGR